MSINEKIKTISNKIQKHKAQYNLDRQTAKTSVLSSGKFSKYELLTGKYVLFEKNLLEKTAELERFEYSPLGQAFGKDTVIKKHTVVINEKEDKRNKLLKVII